MFEKSIQIFFHHILPAALIIYLGLGAILWWFQRSYIFHPGDSSFAACPYFSGAEHIEHNGTRAYYKDNGDPLVVFYHGNAELACDRYFIAELIEREHGYSYLFVEYTGYGTDSDQRPSADALRRDAENMRSFIALHEHSAVILMAESLGSGAAAHHASLATPQKLILLSPMYSLERTAKWHYSIYPVSLLLTEKLPVASRIAALDTEVHIIHGADDRLIPLKHARELYAELSTQEKTLTVIDGVGHNDLYTKTETFDALHRTLQETYE